MVFGEIAFTSPINLTARSSPTFSAQREDAGGAGKVPMLQSNRSFRRPVGGIADQDVILAIGRGDGRGDRVLPPEGGIVRFGQGKLLLVVDADERVEHRIAQPYALHFDGNALALLELDCEVVQVFVLDDTGHCRIQRE